MPKFAFPGEGVTLRRSPRGQVGLRGAGVGVAPAAASSRCRQQLGAVEGGRGALPRRLRRGGGTAAAAGAAGRPSAGSGAPHPPAGLVVPVPASLPLVSKLRNVSNLEVTYW